MTSRSCGDALVSHRRSSYLASCAISLVALLAVSPAAAHPAGDHFCVQQRDGARWRNLGSLVFDKHYRPRTLELSSLEAGRHTLRIVHHGTTAAQLDALQIDGAPATALRGVGHDAHAKLVAADHDVIDLTGTQLDVDVQLQRRGARLTVVGRIEPARIPTHPFAFPSANQGRPFSEWSHFYRYRLGSNPGRLVIDGALAQEALGAPFFATYVRPATGHPAAVTYGWVRDDGHHLFVAIDFVPDNTWDGDKDYAAVIARVGQQRRVFRVSLGERRYGEPAFSYTRRAVYQHKSYELAIPLDALRVVGQRRPSSVELAFAAYGTAAPDVGPEAGTLDQGVDVKDPVKDAALVDKGAVDQKVVDQSVSKEAGAVDLSLVKDASKVADATRPDAGPKKDDKEGCECAVGDVRGSALPLLLLGLAFWLRRRR